MLSSPNWPAELSILPSTSQSIRLATTSTLTEPAAQDIASFGIAGRTWEAAYALSHYLSPSSSHEFLPPPPIPSNTPQTILDLGSGTGFLSLSLAPIFPSSITLLLTDLPEVLPLLQRNVDVLRASSTSSLPELRVRALPWGDEDALRTLLGEQRPDTVLASDLVYFPFLYPSLLKTLVGLTTPSERGTSPKVLFSYKVRSLVREEPFWAAFGRWFDFEAVLTRPRPSLDDPSPAWHRFGSADGIYVFECSRKLSTYDQVVSVDDEELMRGERGDDAASDQFEMMLLSGIELD